MGKRRSTGTPPRSTIASVRIANDSKHRETIIQIITTPLVGGADRNGTAFSDPTDLRSDHAYRASPTDLQYGLQVFVNHTGLGVSKLQFKLHAAIAKRTSGDVAANMLARINCTRI
eukprot:5292078-Pleurochrysis_carterae.AAC.2